MFESVRPVLTGPLDLDDLAELGYPEYLDDESFDYEDADAEDDLDLVEAFESALADGYADAAPDAVEDAMYEVFDSLSPGEAFGFGKALRDIGQGAARVVQDPALTRIAVAALPVAGAAAGTALGGPAGTAVGGSLGAAVAKVLPGPATKATPSATAPKSAAQPVTSAAGPRTAPPALGSKSAAQALITMQQPPLKQALLAAALGPYGRTEIGGIPVGAYLTMLRSLMEEAVADVDRMLRAHDGPPDLPMESSGALGDAEQAQALYSAMIDAESRQLTELTGW